MINGYFFSFDVFDTLMTRRTAVPDGIFALMQDEIIHNKCYQDLPPYVRENFYTLRREAESYAKKIYKTPENQEITFDQIYDVIAFNNGLTDKQKKQIQFLELETEKNNLIPIEGNIQKLKILLSQGK